MKAQNTYIVSLPADAQELLDENSIDLVAELRAVGFEVSRGPLPDEAPTSSQGGKEAVLVLVAGGLTAFLIASAIAKVLDSLGRNRKHLFTEQVLMPVLDGSGKPVKNASGQPILYWSEKPSLVEAKQVTQDETKISIEVRPTMLKFSAKSGN